MYCMYVQYGHKLIKLFLNEQCNNARARTATKIGTAAARNNNNNSNNNNSSSNNNKVINNYKTLCKNRYVKTDMFAIHCFTYSVRHC